MNDHFDLPVLARIDTAWRDPWIISVLAQQGLRHYDEGTPIEDAHCVGGLSGHTWLILGDGVGSKPMSRHGARLATRAVEAHLAASLENGSKPTSTLMRDAFAAAHDALSEAAKSTKHDITDYATTLAAILISGDTLIAGNIGDSAVLAYTTHDKDDTPTPRLTGFASSDQPAAAATFAITHSEWRKHVTVRDSQSPHIKGIVLATDGANGFFIDDSPNKKSAFDTMFIDAFDNAITQLTPRRFCNFFATYLYQNEAENHDDRTLLVAYKLSPKLQPPHARP
jgi:hypothetical protein